MDISVRNQEANLGERPFSVIKSMPGKLKANVVKTAMEARKIGEDDPRKIVHSMKVGLALTLVSFLYYFRPLYDGFGQAGMWAILTVVVVFEFTVGGTLSKCINRGCATLAAGALGIGAEYFADLCGEKGEPVILGILVFLLAAASTFIRFFPKVKRRYDYGVLIFILTFSLVAVSGFRVTEIVQLAHQRLSTILIGGATCIMISVFICPVWAGRDLHNLISGNIEKLSVFLEGFGDELVASDPGVQSGVISSGKNSGGKSFQQSHKSVLNSKATEESLANFAWWEPWHGPFKFCHPWRLYLNIGAQARECAYLIETLNGYLNSKSQHKASSELQVKIQQACVKISKESGKSLKELSSAVRTMAYPSPMISTHAQNYKTALDDLNATLETSTLPTKADLQELLPLLVISSLLSDIIESVEKIASSVHELAVKAHFQKPSSAGAAAAAYRKQHSGIVKPVDESDDHVVIEVDRLHRPSPENKNRQGCGAGE